MHKDVQAQIDELLDTFMKNTGDGEIHMMWTSKELRKEIAQAIQSLITEQVRLGSTMNGRGDPATPKLHGRFRLTDGQVKGIEAWIKEMLEYNNPYWEKTKAGRAGYEKAMRHLHYALITEDLQISMSAGAGAAPAQFKDTTLLEGVDNG